MGRPRQIEHAEIGEGHPALSKRIISKAEELLGIPRNLHETIKSTGQPLALPIARRFCNIGSSTGSGSGLKQNRFGKVKKRGFHDAFWLRPSLDQFGRAGRARKRPPYFSIVAPTAAR
jgi:hypothetical protein